MTNEELIEALGWEPCERDDDGTCCTHFSRWEPGAGCCGEAHALLNAARDGIDLAREGIAAVINGFPVTYIETGTAAQGAREWQP